MSSNQIFSIPKLAWKSQTRDNFGSDVTSELPIITKEIRGVQISTPYNSYLRGNSPPELPDQGGGGFFRDFGTHSQFQVLL
jgi:hypothetical protein